MKATTPDPRISQIRNRLTCPLVLIGMMGAGKTRLGRGLAQALDLPFFDSDQEIEKAAGCLVTEFFERFGEGAFREGEARVINRLMTQGPCVIATGGGAPMTPTIAEKIWKESISIWVRADLETMLERTGRTNRRPILQQGNPRKVIEDLLTNRRPTYAQADIAVDSTDAAPGQALNQAIDKLATYLESGEK